MDCESDGVSKGHSIPDGYSLGDSGNVANMPSLFESVRFLTTAVSSEMAYSSGLQREALFSIALVLFLFIMLINATLNFFLKGHKEV